MYVVHTNKIITIQGAGEKYTPWRKLQYLRNYLRFYYEINHNIIHIIHKRLCALHLQISWNSLNKRNT